MGLTGNGTWQLYDASRSALSAYKYLSHGYRPVALSAATRRHGT